MYKDILTCEQVYTNMKYERDFPILLRTIKGETNSLLANIPEMFNVTFSILNRVKKQRFEWGLTINEVCLKENSKGIHQYSYWDKTHLEHLSFYYVRPIIIPIMCALDFWKVGGDTTNGATHYHTHTSKPDWAEGHTPCAEDRMHKFYNNIQ